MELQEDCYRIHQVLEKVEPKDIIKFLRTKVALLDTERRCQLALQHFLNLEEELSKQKENYGDDLQADFLCIRHLLNTVSDGEIQEILNILGPIPNRKYVAVKLLLRQSAPPLSRNKRKSDDEPSDISKVGSKKLIKFIDLDDSFQAQSNGIDVEVPDDDVQIKEPLKLTIKSVKDRNGNDKFMVTTPTKSKPETKSVQFEPPETNAPEVIELSDQEDKAENSVKSEFHNIYISVNDLRLKRLESNGLSGERPSTSSTGQNFQNKAGPSFIPPKGCLIIREEPSTSTSNPVIAVPSTSTSIEADKETKSVAFDLDYFLNGHIDPGQNEDIDPGQNEDNDPGQNEDNDPGQNEDIDPDQNEDIDPDQNEEQGLDLSQAPRIVDEKLVFKLIELFEDASPDYIRKVCDGREWSEQNFDEIVTVILSTKEKYPKRPVRPPSTPKEVDPEEQFIALKEILNDADPSYLHEKIDEFAGDHDALMRFIEDAMENQNYPTLKEYLRKQQLSAQQRQYTTEFNVERFVELFPDPVPTFEDPNRKTTILDQSDRCYVKWFMRNKYRQLYAKDVISVVDTEGNKNIVSIVKALNARLAKGSLKKARCAIQCRPDTQNIPLLQELAYFDHIEEIYSHIENKKRQAALERENAKELGLLQTCSCCYDDEIMPTDILTCTGGCRFCRDCIKRGTEVAFGEGKVTFPCLMDCGAEFSLQVLQSVLPPKVFSKLAQKKAVAEVKAAGIEDLETCPFCDFATIPAPEDRLFRCFNPDCMKESCRLCKEPSHVPLRCDEVEKDEAVKARTYIEDKMTEALIRQCWKCNAKFIKEEGCNKMTCSCGALMCYVCRKPVKDYKHFNGQGGSRHDLCPLYTDNFSVNEKNVLKAAEEAKKQVDPTQLKNDPTADLQKHFGDQIKAAETVKQQRAQAQRHRHDHHRMQQVIRDQLIAFQQHRVNEAQQIFVGHHEQHRHRPRTPPVPPAHQPPPERIHIRNDIRLNQGWLDGIPNINIEHPRAAEALVPPNNPVIGPRYHAAAPPQQAYQQYPADINNGLHFH